LGKYLQIFPKYIFNYNSPYSCKTNQYITSIGLFYNNWEILLGRVSDCEELVEIVSGSEGRS